MGEKKIKVILEEKKLTKEELKEASNIYNRIREGEKINVSETFLLADYVRYLNKKETSIKYFKGEIDRISPNYKVRSIKKKLRDQKGIPIQLKKNRFKVISDNPSEIIQSQFVCLFKFEMNIKKAKITKIVPGYSHLMFASQIKSQADLIKFVYKKALAQFLTSINYGGGSVSAEKYLKVTVVDTFWVTYLDYSLMVNHDIASNVIY